MTGQTTQNLIESLQLSPEHPSPPPSPSENTSCKTNRDKEMPCLLADPMGSIQVQQVTPPRSPPRGDATAVRGNADLGFLRLPSGDIRPNSAPAVIAKLPLKPLTGQIQDLAGNVNGSPQAGGEADSILDSYLAQSEKAPGGLLSTPIQGSLDFNFPVAGDSGEQQSFVSISLEQELRRDAEARGRSLSPTRSTFEHGVHIAQVFEKPECNIINESNPAAQDSNETSDDLSKLRVQQQQLATQLRFLQEQEWAILDKRSGSSLGEQQGKTSEGSQKEEEVYLQGVGERGGPMTASSPGTSLNTTPSTLPSSAPMDSKPPPALNPPLLSPSVLDLNKNPYPPGQRLDTFVGHIGLVAKDQHGCRFLQKLCEEGNQREIAIIFDEVVPLTGELMVDPFGNYLMQRLCEYCSETQRTVLIQKVTGEIPGVSANMHGTRAVQKVVDHLRTPQHVAIMRDALSKHTVTMVKDLNGNHVIQKCLQKFDSANKQFIYDAVTKQLQDVAMHRHGCCVLQRCIDFGAPEQKMQLATEVVANALILVQDPYGNYVVQYVLDMDVPVITKKMISNFCGSLCDLAMNKFSSNVIEKCIKLATPDARAPLLDELCDPTVLPRMLQDQFANYVVQTALTKATPHEFNMLCHAIRPFLHVIRNTPHGKRIEMKINRKPEPPTSPGTMPLKNPSRGGGGSRGSPLSAPSNTIQYIAEKDPRGEKRGAGYTQGNQNWNSSGPPPVSAYNNNIPNIVAHQQARPPRRQRLRADAPAYAPRKLELHAGVPPTAQW